MITAEDILNLDEDTCDGEEVPHHVHKQSKRGISPESPGNPDGNILLDDNSPICAIGDKSVLGHKADKELVLDEPEANKESVLEPPTYKESVLEAPTHKESKRASNRFVNYHNLKIVIESDLGPCKQCKNKERSLEQTQSVSIATTIEIYCKLCTVKKEQEHIEIV